MVTSYSVCDDFPDIYSAASSGGWEHPAAALGENGGFVDYDAAWEAWEELSSADQFAIGMRTLPPSVHLTPGNLRDPWGTGDSAFDIREYHRRTAVERVAR